VYQGSDSYLTLFGKYSITGRSVVIHANETGARYACADINYGGAFFNESVNTVLANFNTTELQGRMILKQHMSDFDGLTTIKVMANCTVRAPVDHDDDCSAGGSGVLQLEPELHGSQVSRARVETELGRVLCVRGRSLEPDGRGHHGVQHCGGALEVL
jgi:hypothetical protein